MNKVVALLLFLAAHTFDLSPATAQEATRPAAQPPVTGDPIDLSVAMSFVSSDTMSARDASIYSGLSAALASPDDPLTPFVGVGPLLGFRHETSQGESNEVPYLGLEARLGIGIFRGPQVSIYGEELDRPSKDKTERAKQAQAYVFAAGFLVGDPEESPEPRRSESATAFVGYRLGVSAALNNPPKFRLARAIQGPRGWSPRTAHRTLAAALVAMMPTHVSLFVEGMRGTSRRTGFSLGWSK